MPTYDYECLKCKKTFEIFQKVSDSDFFTCPECGGKLKKLISCGCGLIFKGSGFYITDYKRKDNNKTSPKDKSSTKNNK